MRGAINWPATYTTMLTLATLRTLSAAGVKVRRIIVAAGLDYEALKLRMRRGSPELSREESSAIVPELRRLRDALTHAAR